MKKFVVMAGVALTLVGCGSRIADVTMVSTKNYNLNSGAFIKGKRVSGEDKCAVILLPVCVPSVKEAIDRAIETDKCAVALSDTVITDETYAFLFGVTGLKAEGNLVIDKSQPGCAS
ncbi:hypothetical protein [Pseudomonas ovata]|uniref:hypothetical protein n=1 Tax=Pseudomonas ovata TaxID=1839709 RepID=UPI0018735CE8|nr:hypothetical protein [Pseudomonas ovata]